MCWWFHGKQALKLTEIEIYVFLLKGKKSSNWSEKKFVISLISRNFPLVYNLTEISFLIWTSNSRKKMNGCTAISYPSIRETFLSSTILKCIHSIYRIAKFFHESKFWSTFQISIFVYFPAGALLTWRALVFGGALLFNTLLTLV